MNFWSKRDIGLSDCATPIRTAMPRPLSIAFVLQPAFTLVAFSSFVDALRLAADEGDRSRPLRCVWAVVSHDGRPIRASCGVEVSPTTDLESVERYDYVVVVGGLLQGGTRLSPMLVAFLRHAAEAGVPLIGVCTGSFILARAGLLKAHRCCVHWFHYKDFAAEFPDHSVTSNQLFVVDRERITCAGGTSAVHLAAYLIERHLGRYDAQKALRIMIENSALPSGAPQPQPAHTEHTDNVWVRRAMLAMERNVGSRLAVQDVARELHISVRQLERLFHREISVTPAAFARRLRLRHAHELLVDTHRSISDVALESGFADGSHFSRRFRDAFGKTPSQVRRGRRNAAVA